MTHFNHEWDGSPAIPEAVGDRYFAQDLNDDFNYLKHLPYEVFLQGRSRGVMITPNDTWDNDTDSLALSGGFGVILQDNLCVDPDEDFVVPPITKNSPRYERVPFVDVTLVLPNDGATHYIVATPTKRSLLQRMKTVLSESYASRIRYDGVITIQDTAPTAGQILVGLCHNKEYCLLIDNDIKQCKDNIILKKWFGQSRVTQSFVSALQSYYSTAITTISTDVSIAIAEGNGTNGHNFDSATISIDKVGLSSSNGTGILNATMTNCTININNVGWSSKGLFNGTFKNCTINIDVVDDTYLDYDYPCVGIEGGTFEDCVINFNTIKSTGIINGVFNNCIINVTTISSGSVDRIGIKGSGIFNNCLILIDTVLTGCYGVVRGGTFNICMIDVNTIESYATGIYNSSDVVLNLTKIKCSVTTSIPNTGGKLNILNNSVLHAS